jgi:hypothetical protein
MVKRQKKHSAKRGMNQGQNEGHSEPAKISPNTSYEYCSERLSPFGGLLQDRMGDRMGSDLKIELFILF